MNEKLTEGVVEERAEKAKAILTQLQRVLSHWLEGLTARQSAERLGVSARTIEYQRRLLRLVRADGGRGAVKPAGRSYSLKVEVRP